MVGSRIDLEAELDRLFALRPVGFVPARNELAAHLRASGDVAAAGRIKALKRPSVPAWAVNQLRFQAPRLLAALLASADRLRSSSADIPGAIQARREALAEARKKAAEILTAGGDGAMPQTMQRVSATLEALATYGSAPDRPAAGRLTEELPAPGFDEVVSLGIVRSVAGSPKVHGPRAPDRTASVAHPSEKAERTSAREKAAHAKELSAKKREAERRRRMLADAEKKAELARKAMRQLEAALAKAAKEELKRQEAVDAARKAVEALSPGSRPVR